LVKKLSLRASRASRATHLVKPHGFAETYFDGKKIRCAVYRRGEIKRGLRLRVPCIVTEYSATTLIPKGCEARVDSLGNIIVDLGEL